MRLYDENLIAVICGKSGISLKWKAKIVQDNLKLKFKEEICYIKSKILRIKHHQTFLMSK